MGKQCVRIWETLNTYPLFAFLSRVKMRATALTKTRAAFSEVKTVCKINAESVSRGMGNQSSLDMVNGKPRTCALYDSTDASLAVFAVSVGSDPAAT
jgi:hypothetical protein